MIEIDNLHKQYLSAHRVTEVLKGISLTVLPASITAVPGPRGAGKVPRDEGILFPPAPETFASQLVIGTPCLKDKNIIHRRKPLLTHVCNSG